MVDIMTSFGGIKDRGADAGEEDGREHARDGEDGLETEEPHEADAPSGSSEAS
jgi:hypothetical protein